MINLFRKLDEYSQIEIANNYQYFKDSKSVIYLWYYPIIFKTKRNNFNQAHEYFFKHDFKYYNEATKFLIEDNRRKVKSVISLQHPNNNSQIQFNPLNSNINHDKISSLLVSLSLLSNPIYIGKATRNDNIKKRIKEHLNYGTTYSKTLRENLKNSDLTIKDMIVRIIDIESLVNNEFIDVFDENFDLAEYFEKILINLFKPVYNIRN